jgi:hypothetical protein
MNKNLIGGIIMFLGIVAGLIETVYFGYNFTPHSYQELYCDITSGIIVISGIIIKQSK